MTKTVLVRVDDTTHAAIAKAAAAEDRSISYVCNRALVTGFQRQKPPQSPHETTKRQRSQTDADRLLVLLDAVLSETGKTMVSIDAFRLRFYETRTGMSPNANRESFRRSVLALAARGEIDKRDGLIIRMNGKAGRRSMVGKLPEQTEII